MGANKFCQCKLCRIEYLYVTEGMKCIRCKQKLIARNMWVVGPFSAKPTGGRQEVCVSARNKNDVKIEADCCDFCGGVSTVYTALRVGYDHYAACPACERKIEPVHLPLIGYRVRY